MKRKCEERPNGERCERAKEQSQPKKPPEFWSLGGCHKITSLFHPVEAGAGRRKTIHTPTQPLSLLGKAGRGCVCIISTTEPANLGT